MNSPTSIPNRFHKFFWGDNVSELSLTDHKSYILSTLLEKGDVEASVWMLSSFSKSELLDAIESRLVSKKSAHFWKTYLS